MIKEIEMDKEKLYQEITDHLREEGATKIAVFGSFERDDEGKGSDIDILVTFSETKSLLELARIERGLSEKIGIKVDLLTEGSLSPYIKDDVHKEMKEVYG